MKSYNTLALRGEDYTDHEFKEDMAETSGIVIPEHLLYRPEMNDYVLNEVYKQTCSTLPDEVNPLTGVKYTKDEAQEHASELRSQAKKNLNALMQPA